MRLDNLRKSTTLASNKSLRGKSNQDSELLKV
jgi:hypothetical protein